MGDAKGVFKTTVLKGVARDSVQAPSVTRAREGDLAGKEGSDRDGSLSAQE